MARQAGGLQLEGTIGNMIFYKMNGKYYVRSKGAPSKAKLKKGKAFENSRRVSAEFGHASKMASKVVHAAKPLMNPGNHTGLHGKLTEQLQRVLQTDRQSAYGDRKISLGDLSLLEGFDFEQTKLKSHLIALPKIKSSQRDIKVDFSGMKILDPRSVPEGASHFRLDMVSVIFDEQKMSGQTMDLKGQNQLLSVPLSALGTIVLPKPHAETDDSVFLILLGLVFLQEVNGEMHELSGKRSVGVIAAFRL
ncbi:hypothetical protein [Pararhodonellum marinum]|uniref:hypothetical protein n=1 Tax=Pararhodonellum marinum TaxID=2755358 RepID=UPI00188E3F82|nr:hypothetical protein [Pararhodonellum marinum]